MHITKRPVVVVVLALIAVVSVWQVASAYSDPPPGEYATPSPSLAKAASTKFKDCAALLKQFPSGVAKSKKAAGTSGAKVDAKIYAANRGLDRDKDGVACETGGTTNAPTTYTFSNVGTSAYSPSAYTIRIGDMVKWPASHPASFSGAAGVTSRTFTSVGIFAFVCAIHGAQMSGSVTVSN